MKKWVAVAILLFAAIGLSLNVKAQSGSTENASGFNVVPYTANVHFPDGSNVVFQCPAGQNTLHSSALLTGETQVTYFYLHGCTVTSFADNDGDVQYRTAVTVPQTIQTQYHTLTLDAGNWFVDLDSRSGRGGGNYWTTISSSAQITEQ